MALGIASSEPPAAMKLPRLIARFLPPALLVALLVGCSQPGAVNPAAEALAIRELAMKFGAAVAARDVDAVVSFYTFDTIVLDPETPARRGADAMRIAWTEFMKNPGLSVRLVPEKIDVAAAGDLAADFGRFELQIEGPAGKIKHVHKYVSVWRKVGGQWKILYDAWNTNAPALRLDAASGR
jgi:ketosteroid isomerase-like protein